MAVVFATGIAGQRVTFPAATAASICSISSAVQRRGPDELIAVLPICSV